MKFTQIVLLAVVAMAVSVQGAIPAGYKKATIVDASELAKYNPPAPTPAPAAATPTVGATATPVVAAAASPVYTLNITDLEIRNAEIQRESAIKAASLIGRLQNRITSAIAPKVTTAAPLALVGATPAPAAAATTITNPKIAKFIQLIRSKIKSPYLKGGAGPNSFDCSGLVMWAAAQVGLKLPHNADDQSKLGVAITNPANRQVGDLIFFGKPGQKIYHVGVYVGPNTMIDAPHTGAFVRQENYSYWPDKLNTARRIFN